MANEVYIVIFTCTSGQSLTFSVFLENLSHRARIPETAVQWPFTFTDKANEITSLAISSNKLTGLRLPACIITRSGIFPKSGVAYYFMDLV